MGIRDSLDRLRSTRVGRTSKYDSAEHEAMASRYEKKKAFHEAAKKPKEESLKEKAIKKVTGHGKKFVESQKKKALEEAAKPKKSKTKTKKPRPESKSTSTLNNPFDFGFGNSNSNENFGFGMFTPQPAAAKAPEKEVDWSKIYDFRFNTDSSKKRKENVENVWDSRGFWK